jgi:hypothetical protein
MQFKVSGYYQSTRFLLDRMNEENPIRNFNHQTLFLVEVPNFENSTQMTKQINHTQKAIILVIVFENTTPNII